LLLLVNLLLRQASSHGFLDFLFDHRITKNLLSFLAFAIVVRNYKAESVSVVGSSRLRRHSLLALC